MVVVKTDERDDDDMIDVAVAYIDDMTWHDTDNIWYDMVWCDVILTTSTTRMMMMMIMVTMMMVILTIIVIILLRIGYYY